MINYKYKWSQYEKSDINHKKEIVLHAFSQIKDYNEDAKASYEYINDNPEVEESILDELYKAFITAVYKTEKESIDKAFKEINSGISKLKSIKESEMIQKEKDMINAKNILNNNL